MKERWPPIYDAADLADTIRQIVENQESDRCFYGSLSLGGQTCQGGILAFDSVAPILMTTRSPLLGRSGFYIGC